MTAPPSDTFGALLRRCRLAAALTQERLAELAGLSANAVAALEAGRRTSPRVNTVTLLLDALQADGATRARMLELATAEPARRAAAGVDAPVTTTAATTTTATTAPSNGPSPLAPLAPARFPFVGRARELAQLLDAWHRRVRVVLVSGEAGAGKTRLVRELAATVGAPVTVLWGRSTHDRLGAYEPFVDPVRRAVGIGGGSAELARLVPEMAAERGWVAAPSVADPGVERRLLFDAVARLFAGLGPTLLVLDDVQWADTASLALLSHLAASELLPDLVIVGTVRSTEHDTPNAVLSDLRRWTTLERIALSGLSEDELGALVHAIAGEQATSDLVATVHAATDGNALFVEELTEHLLAHGWQPGRALDGTGSAALGVPVPVGVRDTIDQRAAGLSPDAQALLRAGAVLGRRFDVDLAGDLVGVDGGALVAAVEDALLSSLVEEESARSISFSHALVQSAVYEAASARRRLDLHRRAAAALEARALGGSVPDAHVYDIARHWAVVAAADPDAAPKAADWSRRAGDAAAAAADIDEAIVRYERAATLWQGSTIELAETLIRLGAALSARGEPADAEARFRAALALADGLGDVRLYARAAIGLSAVVRYGHSDPGKIAALERAITELPPTEEVLVVSAAVMLKRQLGFDLSQDAYERRQIAAKVVLDAVSAPDLSREMVLSLSTSRDAIVVDDPIVLAGLSRQMIDAAAEPRNLLAMANARYGQAWAALELADGPTWAESVAAFDVVANELGLPLELAMASTMAATKALIAGRYDEGAAHSQRAFELADGIDPNAAAIQMTHQVMAGIDLGHASAMAEFMAAARTDMEAVPTFLAGMAMTAAHGDHRDLAAEILDAQALAGFDRVRRDLEWLPVMGFLCHTCALLGEVDYAAVLYHLLSSHPARAVRVGPLCGFWGPTDFHLGALCRLLGRTDEAERRLRRAIETSGSIGARPWVARSQLELAELLDRPGAPDRREADDLRSAALVIATTLDAPGIASMYR